MNDISVYITPDNTKKYPLHQHGKWEILYYLKGSGVLVTDSKNIPFKKGSIIIVPPKTIHGSLSENDFINISVSGCFEHYFMSEVPILLEDGPEQEGEFLARMILHNRSKNFAYLSSLCSAFICFLLQKIELKSDIAKAVTEIFTQISEHFTEPNLNVTTLLNKSGYSEDYIRAEFKKATNLTPVQFLSKMRIDHARQLLEIYGQGITVSSVMLACGFEDPIYFSRRFKQFVGCSPEQYKKQLLNNI